MPSISHHVSHDITTRREGFGRLEVITGERRRREWSCDEKLAIVAESFTTTTSISDVARRHQLNRNQLFQWRAQFRRGELGGPVAGPFVPLTIAETCEPAESAGRLRDAAASEARIEVIIGPATVRVPPMADEATVRLVLGLVAGLR